MAEGGEMSSESNLMSDLEHEKNFIDAAFRKSLQKGEVRYLVDSRWFKSWKKYVGYDRWESNIVGDQSAHPGPIDMTPLLKDPETSNVDIKEHMVEELDYVFLEPASWDLLVKHYGLMEGQEPIIRNVIENGLYVKLCQVEVYLMEIQLCENSNLDYFIAKKFSKTDTLAIIEKEMRKLFNIPDNKETRLWNKYSPSTYELFSKMDVLIQDAGLYQGQVVVIEQINDDGTWSRKAQSTNSTLTTQSIVSPATTQGRTLPAITAPSTMSTRFGSSYTSNYSYFNENGVGGASANEIPGVCGLNNLGNTCFMNSALQCMSNTPPLTRYFLQDLYWNELNTENPLGMRGEIAKSYADLIKTMWSGKYSGVAPRNFKMQVGKFAPQFSGYQQQDAQELMAFLLDGLHEDLNRIKKKPYIELRDADGRPDEVVADEAWTNYRMRNDSIIVDLFHGLLKSTLVCPDCKKVSVTFDPFGYLSLPLPVKKERQIEIFFVSAEENSQTMQYKLTVPKAGSVRDLCEPLKAYTQIPTSRMFVVDVYDHKIHKVFQKDECLSGILDRDTIFIYEVNDDPDYVILPVYHKEKPAKGMSSKNDRFNIFGQPMVVSVPRKNLYYQQLYEIILKRMSNFVTVPCPEDEWWKKGKGSDSNLNSNEMDIDEEDDDCEVPQDEDEGIDSPEENDVNGEMKIKSHEMLFTMSFINSSGTNELDKLKADGNPISFINRPYLMIDWNPKAKELFFRENAYDAVVLHETAATPVKFQPKKQVIQLNECFELFTTTEKLGADDSWYCPSCKKHQQATKKFDLWSLPKVLVLSFKRFSYNRYLRDKIDTLIEFPVRNLDMQKYVINKNHGPVNYSLVGVSNHFGGMGGGHYTAYCKNKDDKKWYNFDDNAVNLSSEESVVSKAAYVLFYVRQDIEEADASPVSSVKEIPAAAGSPHTANSSTDSEDMETN